MLPSDFSRLWKPRTTRYGDPGTTSRYRKLRLESLEGRWLLSATTWMSNNWDFVTDLDSSGGLSQGDEIAFNGVSASYGVTGFGRVTTGEHPGEITGFNQLQDAIDNTSEGGTLHVLPGLYEPEETLEISASLTLLGPQAGVDPRASQDSPRTVNDETTEAILDGGEFELPTILQISADDVEVNGLSFRGATDADFVAWMEDGYDDWFADAMQDPSLSIPGLIQIQASPSEPVENPRVRHNLIYNGTVHRGIRFRGVSDARIETNQIHDVVGDAINVNISQGAEIRDNELFGNWSPNAAIYVYAATNTEITGNLVYDVHVNDGIKLGSKAGVDALLSGGLIAGNVVRNTEQDGITVYTSDVEVRGNRVSGSRSENGAIFVEFAVDNIVLAENRVFDNDAVGVRIGKDTPPSSVALLNNTLIRNQIGIQVDSSTVLIEGNDLSSNFVGLWVQNGALVDAGSSGEGPENGGYGSQPDGSSWGANVLSDYTGSAGNWAIVNLNLSDLGHPGVQAQNNFFGTQDAGEIEHVVYHEVNDPARTSIDFAAPAPEVRIIDNDEPGFSFVGNWVYWDQSGYQGDSRYVSAGDGSAIATYRFSAVPDGLYRVSSTWIPNPNRATNSPFTVKDASSQFDTVRVNQRLAQDDFVDETNETWADLGGVYPIQGGVLQVQLSNLANGFVIADAVRIERLGGLPDALVPLTEELIEPMIIDDGDGEPGYVESGTWSDLAAGYQGGSRVSSSGTGNDVAAWTFSTIPEGLYRVSATWQDAANRATNAPFTVFDGETAFKSMPISQHQPPSDYQAEGADWHVLGGVYPIRSGDLRVRLTDAANGTVNADAIVIERVGDLPDAPLTPSPSIIDNGDPGYAELGDWFTGENGFNEDNRFSAPGAGNHRATWSFTGVTDGLYRISVTWVESPNRATNAPFTVWNGGARLGTVAVNQQQAPPEYCSDTDAYWKPLGGLYPASDESLMVVLSDAADGYVIADAVRIERVADLPETPSLPATWIVDNADPGYTDTGAWTSWPTGYEGDLRFHGAHGASAAAEWSIPDLPAGLYQIYATWPAHPNRTTQARFGVFDNGTRLATTQVNQRLAPSTLTADSANWEMLGGLFPLSGNELTVRLTPATSGFVIADAIRVERVGEALPLPLGIWGDLLTAQAREPHSARPETVLPVASPLPDITARLADLVFSPQEHDTLPRELQVSSGDEGEESDDFWEWDGALDEFAASLSPLR